MNSYKKFIHILVLIANLYLFRSPVGHILVLIADLYLFSFPIKVTKLILIRISHRSYGAYTCNYVPVGTIDLILIQSYP